MKPRTSTKVIPQNSPIRTAFCVIACPQSNCWGVVAVPITGTYEQSSMHGRLIALTEAVCSP